MRASATRIADASLRQRLLETYRELSAYPEVPAMLRAIRDAGFKTAILSNGAPAMLQAAVECSRARRTVRPGAVGRGRRHFQAASERLSIGGRSPERGDASHLLCQFERLGHRGRRPFRIPFGLDQPRARAARALAGGTRNRAWRSRGIAATCRPLLRMEA